jgi:hypothetical protein
MAFTCARIHNHPVTLKVPALMDMHDQIGYPAFAYHHLDVYKRPKAGTTDEERLHSSESALISSFGPHDVERRARNP